MHTPHLLPLATYARISCGRCHKVYYCSRDCQRQDWGRHKPECSSAAAAAPKKTPPPEPLPGTLLSLSLPSLSSLAVVACAHHLAALHHACVMGKHHCLAWAQNLRLTSAEYDHVKALLKKNDEQFALYVQTRARAFAASSQLLFKRDI